MPLTIRLENEHGSIIGEAIDLHNAIMRLVEFCRSKLAIAHTIDPYGDTTLNYLQIPLFLHDIEQFRQVPGADDKFLQLVEGLARMSQEYQHVYLKFYGD